MDKISSNNSSAISTKSSAKVRDLITGQSITLKPFSQAYVLRTTFKHVTKSIDVSIRKTLERIEEFSGDPQKSQEIFKTLTMLHTLRKKAEDFQETYAEAFEDSANDTTTN